MMSVVLNRYLRWCWRVIEEDGEPITKVLAWLREGGHHSIDDASALAVADLLEQGKRETDA